MTLIYLVNILKKDIIIKMFNVIYYLWACSLVWLEHPTDINFLKGLIENAEIGRSRVQISPGPVLFPFFKY